MAPTVALGSKVDSLWHLSFPSGGRNILQTPNPHQLSLPPSGSQHPQQPLPKTPPHLTDPAARPSPDRPDSSAVLTPGSFHGLPSPAPGSWLVEAAAGLAHSHPVSQIHQIRETGCPQSSADNRSTGTLKVSHAQP